ncbi:MAG: hypothetical protein HYV27_06310 [Candidatus Hydrogenedentes bacterium]|nr:hypothetical protein [Candidatus Hydrogenedentota bacterium]
MALLAAGAGAQEAVAPLERGHSHNDYFRARPLLDALDNGLCSVEADIYLVDGALLVAHDRDKVDPEKTLEALYLAPLRARVQAHGGRVYRDGPSVTLLIDFKSEGEATWAVLKPLLAQYREMLTVFTDSATVPGAVTVIVSGDRPTDTILPDAERLAGIDGRIADLDGAYTAHQMPLISESWGSVFAWKGKDAFPEAERKKLEALVARVHARGQRLRFWALPGRPAVWPAVHAAGVDLINADNVSKLREFLLEQR